MNVDTCKRGHPRTPENTHSYKRKSGTKDNRLCKLCLKENANKAYREATPEIRKEMCRLRNEAIRLKKFGLAAADVLKMVAAQNNRCPICTGRLETDPDLATHSTRPCIDHCHRTGLVRSILCNRCNLLLGHMRDDTHTALRAAKYLAEHQLKHREAANANASVKEDLLESRG